MKQRLDRRLVEKGLVPTRSQAESYIRLGKVRVNGTILTKPGTMVSDQAEIKLHVREQYVSRAGLKLASVAKVLGLDFKDKIVLDVGSSTGGFTDFALQHGAKKVIAVDVGTNQLHPSLQGNPKIELHEQTDIRDLRSQSLDLRKDPNTSDSKNSDLRTKIWIEVPDMVVIDVSFISLREILPHVSLLATSATSIVAMCKPQFEILAGFERPPRLDGEAVFSSRNGGRGIDDTLTEYHRGKTAIGAKNTSSAGSSAARQVREARRSLHKGVIKNDRMRRDILKDFELWLRQGFVVLDKSDSEVSGAKGNRERFYLLKKLS